MACLVSRKHEGAMMNAEVMQLLTDISAYTAHLNERAQFKHSFKKRSLRMSEMKSHLSPMDLANYNSSTTTPNLVKR